MVEVRQLQVQRSALTTRHDDLVDVLSGLGVDIHRTSGDEINGRCPVHYAVKGRESTRNSWYLNSDTGLWHCFTCGARGNLNQLMAELTDDPMDLWNVQSVLITKGIRRLTAEEAEYDDEVDESVTWSDYAKFPLLSDGKVASRNLDAEVAQRFGVRWNPDAKGYTLPIMSPLGELRGWQIKKVDAVWNHPVGVHRHDTFFGIERAFADTAVLVESPLDVVRFHSVYEGRDVSCIASFGAAVADAQIRLASQRFDKLIIALDNDEAGVKQTRRIQKLLPSFRQGVWYWRYDEPHPPGPKDIGDMSDGQIIKGISNVSSIFIPRTAVQGDKK